MRVNIKSEKGAITLVVLVAMLFLLSFLMSIYIGVANKAQTSAESTKQAQEKYNNLDEVNEIYESYFSSSEIIPIYTKEHLEKIGSGEQININGKIYTFSPNGYYTLKNDLDLGGVYNEATKVWSGEQWTPITSEFTGILDGLGKTITGLYINNSQSNQGLFGILKGTVKNLRVEESNVNGRESEIIAGKNEGVIENCFDGKEKEKILTVKCIDSTENVLAEKSYPLLTREYSIIPPEVEGYESAVEKIEGQTNESETINQLYYRVFNDDTTLLFTGLNSSGAATTTESEITSYMIGDGTTTQGNGILEKTVQGILRVPETYKGKPVTQIGQYAIASVNNIIVADTGDVNTVSDLSFRYCQQIEKVILGKGLNNIGSHAFRDCDQLQTLIIETENTNLNFNNFHNCSNFVEIKVNIDNKTYKVEDNILYSKDGKTLYLVPRGREGELVIPDGVETIKKYAIAYNKKIQRAVIPDTVKVISENSMRECSALEEIVIGKMVSNIGSQAFRANSTLKTVIMKSEIDGLIFDCFIGCSNFTEIKVNSDNTTYKVQDNVLYSIDGKTMYLLPTGKEGELVIPEGVEIIRNLAVQSRTKIQKVVIAKTVKTIEQRAFESCSEMQEIVVGENVQNMGSNAFKNCNKLTTVTIDSATIAELITTQTAGSYLVNAATTIYIKDDITTIGSYITDTTIFTKQAESDKAGYVKYVKNS